uniref:AarF domain-containing protein kinase 1 n=1 Tax=Amphiprion percula TaxID=161767 RepID=A0A3P8TC70_AMPPE
MAGRLLKVSSLATAVFASSGFYLYSRQLDLNDLSVVRFGRAAATTAVISYDYLTAFKHVEHGTDEYWAIKSKVHRRSAERLRDLCCANRGTFIKVGQHLGALDYLLPEEYTSTLKVLHSRAPQSSMEEIQQVIREDLGKELQLSELFVSFEEKPQGAASLAQVHKAVLHDGRTVAVKVQHPKVQRQSSKDIMVIERAVHWLFPDFAFMWLVEEAKKNMPLELDFLNEGLNAVKVSNMLADFPFLKVPMIHWDLSTKRILTMEFAEGGQVNDRDYMKKHHINVNEISENLGKIYSEMIFVHGFVHCDPHPGNVLVRKCPQSKKTEIVLLDHGLYQVLQPDFRLDYCRLWQALINSDMSGMERYSRRLGAGDLYPLFACVLTARSWKAVNAGISSVPVTHSEDVEIRTNAAQYLPQISELLNRVPRQMLLLLKTNDLLRGIETTLQTRASSSSFINMSRCCIRAMAHKRSKARSGRRRLQITLAESLSLWKLSAYELL